METQLVTIAIALKNLLAEVKLIRGEMQRANELLSEIKYDVRTKK